MLKTSVGFNSYKDPWNKTLLKINKDNGYPFWVKKFKNGKWLKNYYENYKCIDKLIIIAAKNRYELSG